METEYGLGVQSFDPVMQQWRRLGADEAARTLFRPLTTSAATTNIFLRNGGRLYLDVGSHPEYATAETSSIADLIAQERAGDRIVCQLAERAIEQMGTDGVAIRVQLYRNNVDSFGNSWGSHENYQVRRDTTLREFGSALTGFLVCRQLLCGAGSWVRDEQGRGRLWLSQRARHTWDPVSSTTTRARPMINTRDEPHADPQRYRRLHVIVGDTNLAEPTVLVRIGATELMLRAIESGHRFERWLPEDPIEAIRQVAADPSGNTPFALQGGGQATAVEVLTNLHQVCADFVRGDAELAEAHWRWGQVLDAVTQQQLSLIDTWVDWAIKQRLLRGWAARAGVDDSDVRLVELDLRFHDIFRGQGLFVRAERLGMVDRWVDEARIASAVNTAPINTRARLRARLLEAAQRQHRDHTVDWMTFTVRDLPDGTVVLPDPQMAHDRRVEALIARMANEPRSESSSRFTQDPPPG